MLRQAREAYEKALKLEPDDKGLQEARHKAHVAEHKAMEIHRHKFKRREPDSTHRHKPWNSKESISRQLSKTAQKLLLESVTRACSPLRKIEEPEDA